MIVDVIYNITTCLQFIWKKNQALSSLLRLPWKMPVLSKMKNLRMKTDGSWWWETTFQIKLTNSWHFSFESHLNLFLLIPSRFYHPLPIPSEQPFRLTCAFATYFISRIVTTINIFYLRRMLFTQRFTHLCFCLFVQHMNTARLRFLFLVVWINNNTNNNNNVDPYSYI